MDPANLFRPRLEYAAVAILEKVKHALPFCCIRFRPGDRGFVQEGYPTTGRSNPRYRRKSKILRRQACQSELPPRCFVWVTRRARPASYWHAGQTGRSAGASHGYKTLVYNRLGSMAVVRLYPSPPRSGQKAINPRSIGDWFPKSTPRKQRGAIWVTRQSKFSRNVSPDGRYGQVRLGSQ